MSRDEKSNSTTTTNTSTKVVSSKRGLVLTLLVLAQFMVVVDFMIVQVALPSIGKEFGVSINGLQWTITAYGLTLAGFLMLSGRLGDIYGHKKLFIIGVMLFSLSSLMGGLILQKRFYFSLGLLKDLVQLWPLQLDYQF